MTPAHLHHLATVSRQETAELLRFDIDTITRMLRSGDLKGGKYRGKIRVYVWSIDEYQKKHEITPRAVEAEKPARQPRRASAKHKGAVDELHGMGFKGLM